MSGARGELAEGVRGAAAWIGQAAVERVALVDTNSEAVLLFRSRTTGEPKAAVLRHRHLVSDITTTVEFMSADEDECALVSVLPYGG